MIFDAKFVFKIKVIFLICLVLCLFFLGAYTTWRTYDNSTDFDTYYFAAEEALSRGLIYAEHKDVSPYIYPPFFACLIAPLAVFNMEVASFVWYVFNLGFVFFSLLLCYRLSFGKENINNALSAIPKASKILFCIVTAALFLDNISMLQVNIMMVFLIVLSIHFFKKKLDLLAGLFLAMAISIKIIPIVFFAYFVLKKEFKICVFTLFWIVIFSIAIPSFYLGLDNAWESLIVWYKNMLIKSISIEPNHDMMVSMFNPENQSVKAFLSRLLIKNDFFILHLKKIAHEYPAFMLNMTLSLTKEIALYISRIIVFLLLAVTFIFCRKKIKNRDDIKLNSEYGLMFLAALIANPILKTQQMVLLLFPSILFLSHLAKHARYARLINSAFISFCVLYLLQGFKLFKILGSGTLSILCLWGLVIFIFFIESSNSKKRAIS